VRYVVHTVASIAARSGGPSHSVPLLCDALVRTGMRVSLVSFSGRGQGVVKPNLAEVALVMQREVGGKPILAANRFKDVLVRTIRETEASLVHDHGIWLPSNHATASTCKKLSVPRIVSPHGMLDSWALAYKRFKKRLAWSLYQRSDLESAAAFHVTSEIEAISVRRLGFHQPIAVIPNGIALSDIQVFLKIVSPKRRQVLFLSRLHPVKGLANLISAWATLQPVDWKLVIAGPDEENHREEIQRLINEKGISGSIELVGEADQVEKWRLLEASQVLVLPSHSESFGLVVAEALAMGVPVITTIATPWSELESHGCGWWIEIGVEPLAEALRQAFATDENVLREMGERGAQLIAKKYSLAETGKKMFQFYNWLTSGGTAPSYLYD
jgi:glycosyltransferase involved in cell wall biosynthesis